jgi:hypothetical protein
MRLSSAAFSSAPNRTKATLGSHAMTGQSNSTWQGRVVALLRQGYGAEDIAIRLNCAADDVRREMEILRQEGRLRDIVRPVKE